MRHAATLSDLRETARRVAAGRLERAAAPDWPTGAAPTLARKRHGPWLMFRK